MQKTEHRAPRRPWPAWLLAVLVPIVYWCYWYWHLVRDTRRAARAGGVTRLGPSAGVAVLMVSVGALFVAPVIVSLVQTARLVHRTQGAFEGPRRCRAWLPPVVLVIGAVVTLIAPALGGPVAAAVFLVGIAVMYWPVYYLQAHANDVLVSQTSFVRRPRGVRLAALGLLAAAWACIALPLAVVGGAGLLKPFKVPAGSMEPAYRCGDRFLIENVTKRSTHPERGDVVAFHPPAGIGADGTTDPSTIHTEATSGEVEVIPADVTYFKRVIGLPGDKVEVKDHRAIVNGEALDEPYVMAGQTSPGGVGDMHEREVPRGTYLLLGDHRDNSADSRVFGFVPRSFILGRSVWIYWPLSRFGAPSDDADRGYTEDGPDPACLGSAPSS